MQLTANYSGTAGGSITYLNDSEIKGEGEIGKILLSPNSEFGFLAILKEPACIVEKKKDREKNN